MINLPIEVINKIFLYISSSTASILKNSEFYGKSFPFLYLEQTNSSSNVQIDYHHINNIMKNNCMHGDRYLLFHHYDYPILSENTEIVYILNSCRRYHITDQYDIEDYEEDEFINNLEFLNNIFMV